ncbi:MAG: type II toxin-antitoxin system VapC family toxin [Bryobacteraceae bacterium]|nr:type II toxin-antitoxin system VapC family toxin [Bryobacteraceae bacterium]
MLLLDTCAAIWIAESESLLAEPARNRIANAQTSLEVFLSPITAWEIGLLAALRRIELHLPMEKYIAEMFAKFQLALLTPRIALQSSFLPGELHRDPADRMLVATAREMGMTLVTRDEKLLSYGRAGHVRTLVC